MNYTTNFNLNKPEGTDLYNHLTVDNPNMDIIDGAMQANKLASIGAATELVSGTVHAITRSDSNQNIFKFKATGDFHLGDSVTVDGVSVNAFTTAGQQLLEEAYVLSAEVICVLDGTNLWVLVNKIPDASEIPYNTTDNVDNALDVVGDKTTNMFVTRDFSCPTVSVPGNGYVTFNARENVPTVAGYSFLGFVGFITNHPDMFFMNVQCANEASSAVRNISGTTQNCTPRFRALYCKTSLI